MKKNIIESKIVFIILIISLSFFLSNGLKAKWTAYGKKPAPYSKKYRDKHGIKTPGADEGKPGVSDPPSNTKMLLFFGGCIGMYLFWSRSQQPSTRPSSNNHNNSNSRSNNTNVTARKFAMPGAVSPPSRSSRIIDDISSKSLTGVREARLARLKRFSEEGVNKNKKAMKDALEADVVQNNNNSSSSSNNNIRKRLLNNTKNDNKFGTINSLHQNDDKESDTNKYDGGSGTMYEGRDD